MVVVGCWLLVVDDVYIACDFVNFVAKRKSQAINDNDTCPLLVTDT